MAAAGEALLVARRVSQSAVTKKVAARCRIQIVSDAAADYVTPRLEIGFCVVEIPPNFREQIIAEVLDKLSMMRETFQRCESFDIYQRIQRSYLDRFPLLLPCLSADKAAAAILSAIRIASSATLLSPPAAALNEEQELELLLQGIPCLRSEDIRHLVIAYGSLGEFARNMHDQELELLLGPERARETREYLTVNRPL